MSSHPHGTRLKNKVLVNQRQQNLEQKAAYLQQNLRNKEALKRKSNSSSSSSNNSNQNRNNNINSSNSSDLNTVNEVKQLERQIQQNEADSKTLWNNPPVSTAASVAALQQQSNHSNITPPPRPNPVKLPNLSTADKTFLYHLIDVYKPVGTELWKVVGAEFNKSQPVKRTWVSLRKHYNDSLRRATQKVSGQHQRSPELQRVMDLEANLTGEYCGSVISSEQNNNYSSNKNINYSNIIDIDDGDANNNVIDGLVNYTTYDNNNNNNNDDDWDCVEQEITNELQVNKQNNESVNAKNAVEANAAQNLVNIYAVGNNGNNNGNNHSLPRVTTSNTTLPSGMIATTTSSLSSDIPTIVQISRGSVVKRTTDLPNTSSAVSATAKRARLDTELVKLVQLMSAQEEAAAASKSNSVNATTPTSSVGELQQFMQSIMQQQQLQQEAQQDRYDKQVRHQQEQFTNMMLAVLNSRGGKE
jgi:hypothetical protein